MQSALRHPHPRDLRFLGLVGGMLALIASYLFSGYGLLEQRGSSWRRVDLEAVQQRIDSGDLSGREASWYHPAETAPGPDGEGGRP